MFHTTKTRITSLTPIDIIILSIIFFGEAIISSTYGFLQLTAQQQVAPDTLVFDSQMNWLGIIKECFILSIAYLYLRYRNFDFKQFNFSINRYTPIKIIAYILLAGTVATVYEYLQLWLFPSLYTPIDPTGSEAVYSANDHWSQMSFSLLVLALLNGFFEEWYFLGIIFAIQKKYLPYALMFSLLIRFAFHTYQGLAAALVITTLGMVFLLLRCKDKQLPAFMLAHSFFDVFGLGLPLYLLDF